MAQYRVFRYKLAPDPIVGTLIEDLQSERNAGNGIQITQQKITAGSPGCQDKNGLFCFFFQMVCEKYPRMVNGAFTDQLRSIFQGHINSCHGMDQWHLTFFLYEQTENFKQ